MDEGSPPPPFKLTDLEAKPGQLAVGLTTEQANFNISKYGLNEVVKEEKPICLMLMKQFSGPMQIMIEIVAVLCIIIHSWIDLAIVMTLLLTNGFLGFFEEKSAQASLNALQDGIQKKTQVKRNGKFVSLPVFQVVPGDVVFLRGGDMVPADCYWLSGDTCQIDQSALTGESLPVKVPSKDCAGEDQYSGRRLFSETLVKVGECEVVVFYTGVNSSTGRASMEMMKSGSKGRGTFERKIVNAAKVLIIITAVVVVFLFFYLKFKLKAKFADTVETCLSLMIASVPVALPVVLKVTLSLGAKEIAAEGGIVTHLPALEEIACMQVLCADKTGTLTTANMTVYYDETCPTYNDFTPHQVLEFASLASNPSNLDDPIDAAVLRAYAESIDAPTVDAAIKHRSYRFTPQTFHGFNSTVKRTVAIVRGPGGRRYTIAKGMVDVILKTNRHDGAAVQWECEDYKELKHEVRADDKELAQSGFKTLGVMVRRDDGEPKFAGILPIMDPPRHDTKATIKNIKATNVAIKMITGDHQNIAIELARQIRLGTDIRLPNALRDIVLEQKEDGEVSDMDEEKPGKPEEIVIFADGFAKVKPLDKHKVVACMQSRGMVVGMTGDGVNDAPALAKAHVGIAVHGATDAAKTAADIILTKDGLSPIYSAILISRRIYRRLKSYVIYRICISIQVVFFLTCLAAFLNRRFQPSYIIALALLHDLQIVTIAYDKQSASERPEAPRVRDLILTSYAMGFLVCIQSLLVVCQGHLALSDKFVASMSHTFDENVGSSRLDPYMQSLLFFQISNSSAIVLFSARAKHFFFASLPSWQVLLSTAIGQLIVHFVMWYSDIDKHDIIRIWLYDLLWLMVLDIVKIVVEFIGSKTKTANVKKAPILNKMREGSGVELVGSEPSHVRLLDKASR